ncbi:hypothetical protein J1C52_03865 [Roseibaca sp. Y0-43]|nr:hypothetical protein [Roseibaca sp. Y0-43]
MQRKPLSYPRLIWRLGLVWLLAPLVFGLLFTHGALTTLAEYRALQRDGVQGETQVIAKEVVRQQDSDGDAQLSYYLTHRFRPEGYTQTITTRQRVDRGVYLGVAEGDFLPVTYVWNQPERNTLDPKRDMFGVVFFGLAGAIGLLMALGGAVWGWGRMASARRALLHGEVREARVSDIRKLRHTVNKAARYRVIWQDAAGESGHSLPASPNLALGLAPGDVIVVYIDPLSGRGWWQKQL